MGGGINHSQGAATPLCGRLRLDDFDAVAGVSPVWDERYQQIGRGRAVVHIGVATTHQLQLAYASRSPGVRIRGAATGGAAVVAVPVTGPHMFLQRRPWDPSLVGYAPAGGEYEILSPSPHRILALAVNPQRLESAAREFLGVPMSSLCAGSFIRVREAASREALLRCWGRWLLAATRSPTLLSDPAVAHQMEEEILRALFTALAPGTPERTETPRRRLALRAEAYIRDTLGDPIQLPDICEAVGTSTRSLHASFQQVFGMPPKAYQRALRLDAVRRELLGGRDGTTVSGAAARWGFFQFGYFAMDYRRMFGESPRETLRRSRLARDSRHATRTGESDQA